MSLCKKNGEGWAEDDLGTIIEHICKKHKFHATIIRYGQLGEMDNHGHMWYCFWCKTSTKDHRSFDAHQDFWKHLHQVHEFLFEDIKREDEADVMERYY